MKSIIGAPLALLLIFVHLINGSTAEAASAAAAEVQKEYQVPCLTVSRGDNVTHGALSYLPVRFSRTKANKPLRIMFIDDTPNGSGADIRSSVWLAAITAAMLRNDTLYGVTISVEFSGHVDGPSAGGVTCLTLLSALDGRNLPEDFAMTGTILPDGTIGVVGGVAEKMKAAAKAGKKRIFIPAFLRFELDDKGEKVDLQHLADALDVKLFRVANISEAYSLLHNLPNPVSKYVNIRDISRLPRNIEDVLTTTYKQYLSKVQAELKENPSSENFVLAMNYVCSPALAESLFLEGKLYSATLQIMRNYYSMTARNRTADLLADFHTEHKVNESNQYLKEYHYRNIVTEFIKTADEYSKKVVDTWYAKAQKDMVRLYGQDDVNGFFPFSPSQTEIAAQLEDVESLTYLRGKFDAKQAERLDVKALNGASLSRKEFDTFMNVECDSIAYIHLLHQDICEKIDFYSKLGNELPPLRANQYAADVEQLFYSANAAANLVAGTNFQQAMEAEAANNNRRTDEELVQNPHLMPYIAMYGFAMETHARLTPSSPEFATYPEYHLNASLKVQAHAFAMGAAIMVMYGPDNSNDFIPHLLRNARNSALNNISECAAAGIPCLAPINDLEMAEVYENSQRDTFSALVAYWRAAVYAKGLLMSFSNK